MDKNWEKFAKVFCDRLVFDDGLFYPSYKHRQKKTIVILKTYHKTQDIVLLCIKDFWNDDNAFVTCIEYKKCGIKSMS